MSITNKVPSQRIKFYPEKQNSILGSLPTEYIVDR
jgi:hypothetical protein